MTKFATQTFDDKVKAIKTIFQLDPRLYQNGQFYVTMYIIEKIVDQAKQILDRLSPGLTDSSKNHIIGILQNGFNNMMAQDEWDDTVKKLNQDIVASEANGNLNLSEIRAMIGTGKPGLNESKAVRQYWTLVWSTSAIKTNVPIASPTVKLAKAARAFEDNQCGDTINGFSKKLLGFYKITTLERKLRISGVIGNAVIPPTRTQDPKSPLKEQQIVIYHSQQGLARSVATMKQIVQVVDCKFKGAVMCGVLSGVRQDRTTGMKPEHWILVLAYDQINGQDAFLFWDPDVSSSNIKSTTWGRGFGVLFSRPGRLTTAVDEADLRNIDRLSNKRDGQRNTQFGWHLEKGDVDRHLYQVFWMENKPN